MVLSWKRQIVGCQPSQRWWWAVFSEEQLMPMCELAEVQQQLSPPSAKGGGGCWLAEGWLKNERELCAGSPVWRLAARNETARQLGYDWALLRLERIFILLARPSLLLPTSKRQRAGADRNAGGSVKRGQLGVVVAPLMGMACLHTIKIILKYDFKKCASFLAQQLGL